MANPEPRSHHLWRLFGGILSLAVLAVSLAACSTQSSYPTKGITLIVPSGAGGASDLAARPLTEYLSKKWGQPISISYKSGAGGAQGIVEGLQAPPDGYTMMTIANSQGTINPALEKDLPYKWDQPVPVARFNTNIMVLTVKGDAKWNTAKEFMDAVTKDPAAFKHGTSSPAGPSTMCTAQLLFGAKVDAAKVGRIVFQGGGPMVTALAGGNVDFIIGSVSEVLPLVQGKNLKALMVTGSQRVKELADVPTGKEAGFPWFTWLGYTGICAPPNIPDAILNKWSDSIKEASQDSDFQAKLRAAGGEPSYLSPSEFKSYLKTSFDETVQFLTQLGLKL